MKKLLICCKIGILLMMVNDLIASGSLTKAASNRFHTFTIKPQQSDTSLFADILFASGSARLQAKAKMQLDRILSVLKLYPELELSLAGHADHIGKMENNFRLSSARVDACRLYLMERGIASERLMSGAYGETRPKADNSSRSGRKMNRRVECIPIRR